MAAPNLPVNIDTTYVDDASDSSVKVHQQHHDEVHKVVNLFDDATPSTSGSVPAWNGTIHSSRVLDARDAKDKIGVDAAVTGAKTADMSTSTTKVYTLTGNTTFTFSGAPTGGNDGQAGAWTLVLKQDATGGRTVTWPTVKWPSGTAPSVSSAANSVDVYTFFTVDTGSTWYGFQSGKGLA